MAGYAVIRVARFFMYAPRNLLELDILLALKGRGFLLQDGDVPPRGLCELR